MTHARGAAPYGQRPSFKRPRARFMTAAQCSHRSSAIQDFRSRFEAHIQSDGFPCVGARSAVQSGRARYGLYRRLGEPGSASQLCRDLELFSGEFPQPGEKPATFVAMFDDTVRSEADFEERLWRQLQELHWHDRRTFEWDPSVSDNPADAHFSFSIAGRAFFVVGLCPAASRIARRAPMPCLVFNFHDQFENLRASGKYKTFQSVIRARDIALQGELNPALSPFGEQSEARQYSGRDAGAGWRCPFSAGTQHGR